MWSSWISQLSIANLQSLIPGPPLWKWKYQSRCMPVSSLAVIPVSFIPWILSLRHGPSTNKQQMLKCLLWLTLDLHHRLPFSSKVLNSKQRVMQVWLILWHGRTDVCLSVRKKPVCYIVIMTNILRAKSGMNFLKSPCWCVMYLCKKRTLLSLLCWPFLNAMQLWGLSSFYGRQIIMKSGFEVFALMLLVR